MRRRFFTTWFRHSTRGGGRFNNGGIGGSPELCCGTPSVFDPAHAGGEARSEWYVEWEYVESVRYFQAAERRPMWSHTARLSCDTRRRSGQIKKDENGNDSERFGSRRCDPTQRGTDG